MGDPRVDLVDRAFDVEARNRLWVGDIACIGTGEGWPCLESHGIAQSVLRPGNPWDDALAESFFKTLKRELVNGKGCKTREEAKQDVFKYIELYYNTRRMLSSIGYNAPCGLERDVA